jgi:hypothetical protein
MSPSRSPRRPRGRTQAQWSLTKLEPRILLAADAGAAVSGEVASAAAEVATPVARQSGGAVVFIDSAVSDIAAVAAPIAGGADLVLLTPGSDGIQQIRDYLDHRSGVRAVHIVSHGSAGLIQLGSTNLDASSLGRHAEDIRGWSNALAVGADILF